MKAPSKKSALVRNHSKSSLAYSKVLDEKSSSSSFSGCTKLMTDNMFIGLNSIKHLEGLSERCVTPKFFSKCSHCVIRNPCWTLIMCQSLARNRPVRTMTMCLFSAHLLGASTAHLLLRRIYLVGQLGLTNTLRNHSDVPYLVGVLASLPRAPADSQRRPKQTTLSLSALCASGSWRQNTPASTFVSARTSFTLLIRGGRPAGRPAPAHNTKAPSAPSARIEISRHSVTVVPAPRCVRAR